MKSVLKRLTYANVMSSIAVFLVLAGGTALAANQLGKNTVGANQLKKNAVTTAKIKNGAVTGAKLNLSTVGKVPSATTADSATSAKIAEKATTADKALTADKATTATNATTAANATNAAHADTATVAGAVFSQESGTDVLAFPATANTPVTAASINVPGGNYVVVSKVLANNNEAAVVQANCQLLAAGTVIDNVFNEYISLNNEIDRGFIALTGVAALPAGGQIAIQCQTTSKSGNYLDRALTATRVAAVG
jgi:hypothetical protein